MEANANGSYEITTCKVLDGYGWHSNDENK